jgi:hypothetical protein
MNWGAKRKAFVHVYRILNNLNHFDDFLEKLRNYCSKVRFIQRKYKQIRIDRAVRYKYIEGYYGKEKDFIIDYYKNMKKNGK